MQLVIVVAVLAARGLFYRGPAGGGKAEPMIRDTHASASEALGDRRSGRWSVFFVLNLLAMIAHAW